LTSGAFIAIEQYRRIRRSAGFQYTLTYAYVVGALRGCVCRRYDAVFEHGLAYARSEAFYKPMETWQWLRIVGDVVFAAGAVLMSVDFVLKLLPFSQLRFAKKSWEQVRDLRTRRLAWASRQSSPHSHRQSARFYSAGIVN